jgi:hypothetical protein
MEKYNIPLFTEQMNDYIMFRADEPRAFCRCADKSFDVLKELDKLVRQG